MLSNPLDYYNGDQDPCARRTRLMILPSRTLVTNIKGHTRFTTGWTLTQPSSMPIRRERRYTTIPAIVVLPGSGNMSMNTYVVEAGLSYLLRKELIFHLDYRFHALDQNGRANTDGSSAPASSPSNLNLMANTGTFQLEYIPRDKPYTEGRLQGPSTRMSNGDNYYDAGIGNGNGGKSPSSNTSWLNGWVGAIDWKPYKFLTVFGEYEGANFSNPYTWISMETRTLRE